MAGRLKTATISSADKARIASIEELRALFRIFFDASECERITRATAEQRSRFRKLSREVVSECSKLCGLGEFDAGLVREACRFVELHGVGFGCHHANPTPPPVDQTFAAINPAMRVTAEAIETIIRQARTPAKRRPRGEANRLVSEFIEKAKRGDLTLAEVHEGTELAKSTISKTETWKQYDAQAKAVRDKNAAIMRGESEGWEFDNER